MSCFLGGGAGGASGLKQYGKADCTFVNYQMYVSNAAINLPTGLIFSDILQMSITQEVSGENTRKIFKYSNTQLLQSYLSATPYSISSNATSIGLPYDNVTDASSSVTGVIIIANK